MNVSEALIEIRNKTNDRDEVGLDNEELLAYFNEAIQFISQYLAAANSPVLIHESTITTATVALPDNFIKLAGIYPVKSTGQQMKLLDTPPQVIRYYANIAKAEMNGDIPLYNEALIRVAIRLAAVYVQNQQELDITQDKGLVADFQQAIIAAVGGAPSGNA